ncbi:ribonuclease P protein component [Propioniferax innocua]|uniref:Ribonuclease P protein component n=1 Tax=Propioniferax innocua TaxID=1753 RepID=A0A542ZDS4_9ACTN|nr:ribonuclease P protein component [Propioniferax innocua]TQL58429.1 ribonuclease P protein component [Propioniferax innocua]
MLSAAHRMREGEDFRLTVRRGVRSGRSTVVVHARPSDGPTLVGFVVSTAVGNAVCRNRVKRRLRHLTRPLVEALEDRSFHVVVRALPPAANADRELADDLHAAWERSLRKCEQLTP